MVIDAPILADAMVKGYIAPHRLSMRVRRGEWKPLRHQRYMSWRIAESVPSGNAREI